MRDQKLERLLLATYVVAAIVVSIQRGVFSFPNDYAIFRASYLNLVSGQDLYVIRLSQAHDYFKYSPTFALLFAPFAVLPFVVGLFLWNALNATSLFFAFQMLYRDGRAPLALALVALPTLRSMQSAQSNSLVAALIIVAFVCFERGWIWRGAIAVGLGAVIKIFPLAALSFALPRRERLKAFSISVLVIAVLVALPLVVVPPSELIAQYRSWSTLESREATLLGASLMAVLHDAGLELPAWPVQSAAVITVLGVLAARWNQWKDRQFRLQFLGFVLVFCVLFNHRAERQAAVIAVSGMAIWFLASAPVWWRVLVLAVVFALVSVVGADVVPGTIKAALPAHARFPIPLTILWLVMLTDLLSSSSRRGELSEADLLDSRPGDVIPELGG
ncbi:MAG: glycosyltransferase family 87 protein [Gemmatimonadaceae bacterium]